VVGWLLYPLGDLIAQLMLHHFCLERLIAITLMGGLVYRFEIPHWFLTLDNWSISPEMKQALSQPPRSARLGMALNLVKPFITVPDSDSSAAGNANAPGSTDTSSSAGTTSAAKRPLRAGHLNWLGRTIGGMAYFNPLWIARHIFVIYLTSHHFQFESPPVSIVGDCFKVGCQSFMTNLPLSLLGNYVIQEKLPADLRFAGSATLSAIMAGLYAIEYWFFSR
jgi:hypothetical protein